MTLRIRLLLADDSPTMLSALEQLLGECADIEVIGHALDGAEAVSLAKCLRPDVITMDVMMPKLDGLGATAAIMADAPARVLMVCSVQEAQQLDLSFRAIEAGALELIAKPNSRGGPVELRAWGLKLAEAIRLMAEVPVVTRRRVSTFPLRTVLPNRGTIDAVGLVASTGGPPALALVLGAIPADFPAPILIAQHMTAGFTAGLVQWLTRATALRLEVATAGTVCRPGWVYLPPDGHHLEVDVEGVIQLPPFDGHGHCPSGDRLLGTLARAYGSRAGGVVLTGMGDDGSRGLLQIRQAGGETMAQDESSSVVFGMPQAAFAAKATQTLLPLEMIAPMLRELCNR